MMTHVNPHDPDDQLLETLCTVFDQIDPVPTDLSEAARAVFALRDLDAELIPLVESLATTAVRGDDDAWLSFALEGLEIDLGSRRERHSWQLIGQVTGSVSEMSVRTMAGIEPVDVDSFGRFRAAISAPTLSLRVTTADGRQMRTEWVTL